MEACVRILSSGLTAAIYGPTSGKDEDKTLFQMAQFNDYPHDLCQSDVLQVQRSWNIFWVLVLFEDFAHGCNCHAVD
jgi:hypothetical protein